MYITILASQNKKYIEPSNETLYSLYGINLSEDATLVHRMHQDQGLVSKT